MEARADGTFPPQERGQPAKEKDLIGRTIAGKFAIESFIGGGAMGAVYKARQIALDKYVAIKVLHEEHSNEEAFAARFKREAQAASRLDHPNSIRVIDFGEEPDGLLYIAMELVEGRDLYRLLQQDGPLPPARIADIVMQTLAALAVAHELGIVHRDLKPENIMVLRGADDEGNPRDIVKVCDFGIAKMTEPRSEEDKRGAGRRLTTQGLVVGTPEYMSPEQAKGEGLDHRSDLYSVGVILYQLLTGRVPFDAEMPIAVVLKHVTEEPVPPSQIQPNVDPRLEAVCLKAMQKKKEDRYQTAREMRADLRSVLHGYHGSPSLMPAPFTGSTPGGDPPVVSSAGADGQQSFGSAATMQAFGPTLPAGPAGIEATADSPLYRSKVLVGVATGAVALVLVMLVVVANLRRTSTASTTTPTGVRATPPAKTVVRPAVEPSGGGSVAVPVAEPSHAEPIVRPDPSHGGSRAPARGQTVTSVKPSASASASAPPSASSAVPQATDVGASTAPTASSSASASPSTTASASASAAPAAASSAPLEPLPQSSAPTSTSIPPAASSR